jgi:hypothetical protein
MERLGSRLIDHIRLDQETDAQDHGEDRETHLAAIKAGRGAAR